jgi:hypothetical protein
MTNEREDSFGAMMKAVLSGDPSEIMKLAPKGSGAENTMLQDSLAKGIDITMKDGSEIHIQATLDADALVKKYSEQIAGHIPDIFASCNHETVMADAVEDFILDYLGDREPNSPYNALLIAAQTMTKQFV